MNRRQFFKQLKQAACIIALAPQIAFHVRRKNDDLAWMHAYEVKACGIPRYNLTDWLHEQERKHGKVTVPYRKEVASHYNTAGDISRCKVNHPSPETLKKLFKC